MNGSVQRLCRRPAILAVVAIALGALLIGQRVNGAEEPPRPDPAGTATGGKSQVYAADRTPFVVAEPSDPSAPDYEQQKKAYAEFRAEAAREPLAMRLADAVGHLRTGANFAWTLNTGFLVLFMQAGFALLTTGLVRKKNAA